MVHGFFSVLLLIYIVIAIPTIAVIATIATVIGVMLLKALAKSNGNLFAIAFNSEKE